MSGPTGQLRHSKTKTCRALLWGSRKFRNSSRRKKSRSTIQSSKTLICHFTIRKTKRKALTALMITISHTRTRKEAMSLRLARARRFSPNRSIEKSRTHHDAPHTKCNPINPRKTKLKTRTNLAR
jgi:hypothetical protein